MADECIYCQGISALNHFLAVIDRTEYSTLYFSRYRRHPGRCIVALNRHARELDDLPPAEFRGFMEDMARLTTAMRRLHQPDKINYGIYGDVISHIHLHLVPKRNGGEDWGGPFMVAPSLEEVFSEAETAKMVGAYREELQRK